ncbi:inner membrane protein [Escherichia coli]|nr:inner membrane protein [Escherichia coli]
MREQIKQDIDLIEILFYLKKKIRVILLLWLYVWLWCCCFCISIKTI